MINTPPRVFDSNVRHIPSAIWIPQGGAEPAIYRGQPIEMVQEMARETGHTSLYATIGLITQGLSQNRRVKITLPADLSDDALSTLFIYALLTTGVAQKMPQA
jgi:hypothetical protein